MGRPVGISVLPRAARRAIGRAAEALYCDDYGLRRAKPMPSDRLIAAVAKTVDAAVDAVRSARTCSPVRTATTK